MYTSPSLLIILLDVRKVVKVTWDCCLLIPLIVLVHSRQHASRGRRATTSTRILITKSSTAFAAGCQLEELVKLPDAAAGSQSPRRPVREQRLRSVARRSPSTRAGARYGRPLSSYLLQLLLDQGLRLVGLRVVKKEGTTSGL